MLTHPLRAFRRSPLFFVIAVASLGIGIGSSTTVYSWMNGLVLHPFPGVREADRLVGVEVAAPDGDGWPLSFPTYRDWREATRSLSGIAAWSVLRLSARSVKEQASTSLVAVVASGNYFEVLGVPASLGRALEMADERMAAPVAVLSHQYWQRAGMGDASVIGSTIFLNGVPISVVGIAPENFAGTYVGVVPDIFVPITLAPTLGGARTLEDRSTRWVQSFARLAPSVTLAQASGELNGIARRLSAIHGERPATGALVVEARMQYLGQLLYPLFVAMLVVTSILLLVASANLVSFMQLRAEQRRYELAVRLSLGASIARLMRHAMTEVLVLSMLGCGVGIGVTFVARGLLYRLLPTGPYPITLPIAIDGRVLAFAAAASILAGLICGLGPLASILRVTPSSVLRSASRSIAGSGARLRLSIVVGQIAFSLLCVFSAALFVRSLRAASSVHPGFTDPDHVLLVNTDFATAQIADSTLTAVIPQLLDRLREIPGARSATVASMVPLGFGGHRTASLRVEGYTPAQDENIVVERVSVGSDYARTMGIGIVDGRDILSLDGAHTLPIAVVNETLAQRFSPGRPILERRIDAGHGWATVVGLLRDGKYSNLTESPHPVAYFPITQWPLPAVTVHVRTSGDPHLVQNAVRDILRRTHVDLPALQPRTLSEHIAAATFVSRTGASVLSTFGLAALLLSVIGVFGTLSHAVTSMTREIGIRTALGAGARATAWMVLRGMTMVVGLGIVTGGGFAWLIGRWIGGQLPGVDPTDPAGFVVAATLLVLAVGVAAFIPTRRALRVDPVIAMRAE